MPRSGSPSRAPSRERTSGNESNDREPPAAKKRKTKAKPSARGRRVGKSGREKLNSRTKSPVDAVEQDITMSDGDDDFVPSQDTAIGELARERELRPRVKPVLHIE